MIRRNPFRTWRALRSEDGSATVEFVILFPIIFGIFLTSVDFSIQMLRQVFLDRAVDLAIRDIRLGRVQADGLEQLKQTVCSNAALTPNCMDTVTVELRPVTAQQLAAIDPQTRCIDRAANITPLLTFTPGSGAQELMMLRACTVSNPFIVANGFLLGSPRGPNDDFMSVSIGVFVNEPT
jgi:Flp pilus assembly protein TadG